MPMTRTMREDRCNAWSDFQCGFRRSKRGNLWREYSGLTLTIFKRKDGFYGWCIAAADSPQFSPHSFGSEKEALADLFAEVAAV